MRDADFGQLQSALLRAGIAPRHVRRMLLELQDHYTDLVEAELEAGQDPQSAARNAGLQLGDLAGIVEATKACPELRSWGRRFPRLAVVVYPLTCLALLPAVPVFVGVAHAPQLARWSMSLLFGALVTAGMLLLLQLSILLT